MICHISERQRVQEEVEQNPVVFNVALNAALRAVNNHNSEGGRERTNTI